jgi:hypothetical protein
MSLLAQPTTVLATPVNHHRAWNQTVSLGPGLPRKARAAYPAPYRRGQGRGGEPVSSFIARPQMFRRRMPDSILLLRSAPNHEIILFGAWRILRSPICRVADSQHCHRGGRLSGLTCCPIGRRVRIRPCCPMSADRVHWIGPDAAIATAGMTARAVVQNLLQSAVRGTGRLAARPHLPVRRDRRRRFAARALACRAACPRSAAGRLC